MGDLIRRSDASGLDGVRVLIVEDDTLILMELEAVVEEAGAELAGSCRSVMDAMAVLAGGGVDVAILDFGLRGDTATPVARTLAQAGVPFMFYTGQVNSDPRLAEWRGHRILAKPAQPSIIVAELVRLLARE